MAVLDVAAVGLRRNESVSIDDADRVSTQSQEDDSNEQVLFKEFQQGAGVDAFGDDFFLHGKRRLYGYDSIILCEENEDDAELASWLSWGAEDM